MRRSFVVAWGMATASCLAQPSTTEVPAREEPGHWSFRALKPSAPPVVSNEGAVRNPIDRFVLAQLEREGRGFAPEASAGTLARRVSLDLVGLPAPELVPANYEEFVDALLASPHYGEHLAREWLDAARYADTHGYHVDLERPMWPWRDWVIDAFNSNMPFDRFTIEQLAGDLLPDATPDQVLATAFNRNHPITAEGGVIDEELRIVYAADRVATLGAVFLGLTTACARCHDHKYDPLTQRDFYSLLDCFNHLPEVGDGPANSYAPFEELRSPTQRAELSRLEGELAELSAELDIVAVSADSNSWAEALSGGEILWETARVVSAEATQGAQLEVLPEQLVRASGENPSVEAYELAVEVDLENIRAIRVEALPDFAHPVRSAGRSASGNFVLTELELYAESDRASRPVKFSDATADHHQPDFAPQDAFDGSGATGWAISGALGVEHHAIFNFAEPLAGGTGTRFFVRLRQDYGGAHTLGRFRLSFAATPSLGPSRELSYLLHGAAPEIRENARRRERLRSQHALQEKAERVLIMKDSVPRETRLLLRGNYETPVGEILSCRAPEFLPPFAHTFAKNRLGLAEWLVTAENPLTARVIVNRYWRMVFGRGLTETVEDLGLRGEYPKDRELLDWLAWEFISSGWDVKALLRLMVTSTTYRQASQGSVPLTAEQLRDQALFVSGILNPKIGGKSVLVRQPPGLWEELNDRPALGVIHHADSGERAYRRSVYTFWKRSVPPPMLAIFDAPSRELSVVRRERTATPQQALVLLHEPELLEAARVFAEKMTAGSRTPEAAIERGIFLLFHRGPRPNEVQLLRTLYSAELEELRAVPEDIWPRLRLGEAARHSELGAAEHAALTQVARALLSSREAVVKE